MSPLVSRALDIARGEVGVREVGRNRGQRVEEYQKAVGLLPGDPWCAAFVCWAFVRAAEEMGEPCPIPKGGAVNKLWRRAPEDMRRMGPAPGYVFIRYSNPANPYSLGHTGIVESISFEGIWTIEGNTDDGGSREGDGVYRRLRPLDYVNIGYIRPRGYLDLVA